MATALRQRIGEYFRKLFFLQGLPAPQNGAQNATPAATVTGTGALPPSPAASGHTQVTVTTTGAPPAQSPPTVLGDDVETGEAVSLTLNERLQGLYVIGATGTGKNHTTFEYDHL